MDTVKIGALLKTLRKEHGMTQEQLAEKSGVTNRTVSRWEVGSNMPDLDIIIDLSELYQIEIKDLFNGEKKTIEVSKENTESARQLAEYNTIQETHVMRKICFVVTIGVATLGLLFYTTLKAFDNIANGRLVGLLLCAAFIIYNIAMQAFRDNKCSLGYRFILVSGFLATTISNILVLSLFFFGGSYHNYGLIGILYIIAIVISVFVIAGIITIVSIRRKAYTRHATAIYS